MKTILQGISKTLEANTSSETRETDRALLTCHVKLTEHLSHKTDQFESRQADSQQNQVERLFPEFFTRCSEARFTESFNKAKVYVHSKLEQEDPLIQSWLNLYGGSS